MATVLTPERIKELIQEWIVPNGKEEIRADMFNTILSAIMSYVGVGYACKGVAPQYAQSSEVPVLYIGGPGTYKAYYNEDVVVPQGSIIIWTNDLEGAWSHTILDVATSIVAAEVQRATEKEGQLQQQITSNAEGLATEIQRATGKEGQMQQQINANTENLAAEVQRATEKEGQLQQQITSNAEGLAAEIQRATGKEGQMQEQINANTEVLAAEILRAQAAESRLQDIYEGLTQNPVVVGPLPSSGQADTIYRVPGTSSYADYMWDGTQFVLMATYTAGHVALINVNVLNHDQGTPHAAYASAAAARADISAASGLRALGLQITYLLTDGVWYTDQYIGTDISGWNTASNWKTLGPVTVTQNTETEKTEISVGTEKTTLSATAAEIANPTTSNRIKMPSVGALLDSGLTILDISALFPNSGVDSSDHYTLSGAIAKVSNKYEKGGITLKFKNAEKEGYPYESWFLNSATWSNKTSLWRGIVDDLEGGNKNAVTSGAVEELQNKTLKTINLDWVNGHIDQTIVSSTIRLISKIVSGKYVIKLKSGYLIHKIVELSDGYVSSSTIISTINVGNANYTYSGNHLTIIEVRRSDNTDILPTDNFFDSFTLYESLEAKVETNTTDLAITDKKVEDIESDLYEQIPTFEKGTIKSDGTLDTDTTKIRTTKAFSQCRMACKYGYVISKVSIYSTPELSATTFVEEIAVNSKIYEYTGNNYVAFVIARASGSAISPSHNFLLSFSVKNNVAEDFKTIKEYLYHNTPSFQNGSIDSTGGFIVDSTKRICMPLASKKCYCKLKAGYLFAKYGEYNAPEVLDETCIAVQAVADGTQALTYSGNNYVSFVVKKTDGSTLSPSDNFLDTFICFANVTDELANLDQRVTNLETGGGDISSFDLQNPQVKSYIDNVTYSDDDYTTTEITDYATAQPYRTDYPLPVRIAFSTSVVAQAYYLLISTNSSVSFGSSKKYEFLNNQKEILVYNLIPNKTYYYKIYGIVDGVLTQIKSSSFTTTGQVRMLKIGGLQNVRDIGGWSVGNNQKVKYDMLFRGVAFQDTTQPNLAITDDGVIEFRDMVGIKTELDLRGELNRYLPESGGNSLISRSGLGRYVDYEYEFYLQYVNAVNDTSGAIATIFGKLVTALSANKKVYFHCQGGCDRTGTLAFFLLGVLGVSESDLAKEYELTSFSAIGSGRRRNSTTYNYSGMVAAIKEYTGATLKDKIEAFLLAKGVSSEDIATFRTLMIE